MWPVHPMEHESSGNTSFGLWSPDESKDTIVHFKCFAVSHPFKRCLCSRCCASAKLPLGGARALCLNLLLICLQSPAPVQLSPDWPQTLSSFPVGKGENHKHESQAHNDTVSFTSTCWTIRKQNTVHEAPPVSLQFRHFLYSFKSNQTLVIKHFSYMKKCSTKYFICVNPPPTHPHHHLTLSVWY